MKLPRVRFTVRRMMVAAAIVALVALAHLPEPALLWDLHAGPVRPFTLGDGTTRWTATGTLQFSRLGLAVLASLLVVVGLGLMWLVRRILGVTKRPASTVEPDAPRPRFRWTVRRAMTAVAIFAASLGIVRGLAIRSTRLRELASDHFARIEEPYYHAMIAWGDGPERLSPRDAWRLRMSLKYSRAADRPWLPVAPDPPEPD